MGIQLKNNAVGYLATAISASDTGAVLQTGNGASSPTLGAGDYFYATLESTGGTSEIVKVTVRSGDSLTIARAQEGTTAQSFAAGSRFELRVTAASVRDLVEEYDQASEIEYTPAGIGAVATNVQSKLRESVSTADFPTLQAALDYCKTSGHILVGVPGEVTATSTVVIECSCDLSMMTIRADGSTLGTAVRVGPNVAGEYLFDADLKLPFVLNTAKVGAGWSGFDSSIGIEVANVYQSRIVVPSVYNFGIGLKTGGYGVGNVYNTYTIGVLFGNKINLQCKPGDASGWSNQNTYIGGRYGYSSAEGTAVSGVVQIQLRDFDGTGPSAPNTNVWINPSVEGNEPEFHFDIQGAFNTIISPRLELTGGVFAKINFHAITANETVGNQFIGGYKYGVTYSFSGAGTSVNNGHIASRGSNTFDFSGSGYNVRNTSGNTISAPHFQGFPSSVQPLPKDNTATDWTYRIYGEGFAVKATANTQPRVQMDSSGYVSFGTGSAAVAGGLRYNATPAAITSNIDFAPDANATLKLGTANRQWAQIWANLATYADNAAALVGGLTAGAFYKTATGELRVVV